MTGTSAPSATRTSPMSAPRGAVKASPPDGAHVGCPPPFPVSKATAPVPSARATYRRSARLMRSGSRPATSAAAARGAACGDRSRPGGSRRSRNHSSRGSGSRLATSAAAAQHPPPASGGAPSRLSRRWPDSERIVAITPEDDGQPRWRVDVHNSDRGAYDSDRGCERRDGDDDRPHLLFDYTPSPVALQSGVRTVTCLTRGSRAPRPGGASFQLGDLRPRERLCRDVLTQGQ